MKNYTDRELADFMLEMRRHGGRTRWRQLKANAWRWLLFVTLVLILAGAGLFAQARGFSGFVLGLAVGIFSRDGVWLRLQRLAWPFYAKIVDWGKVERIANGEALA